MVNLISFLDVFFCLFKDVKVVGISLHVLDHSKSNRCLGIFKNYVIYSAVLSVTDVISYINDTIGKVDITIYKVFTTFYTM